MYRAITILLILFVGVCLAQAQQKTPAGAAVANFVLQQTLSVPVQPIRGLGFGGEHDILAALGGEGSVRLWNAATGSLLKTLAPADHPKSASCMAFSPDGKWVVIGESFTHAELFTAKLELFDAREGRPLRTLATHHWEVESLVFSRDGRWLISSNWDRKVRVMEFPSGSQVCEFETPAKPHCAAISPDSKTIASGGYDFTVSLWDRETGKQLCRLAGHSGVIAGVNFSPDGKYLVSASADGSARIWNVSSGQCLHTLSGHDGIVACAVYSPDGRLVVTGGADGTVRFWDAGTGQNLETLGAHSAVWQVAFSRDGKYLAAGYANGMVNLWQAPTADGK